MCLWVIVVSFVAPEPKRMTPSVRQIQAFVAVARAGSFTEAARQIHLTQSAVSMLVLQMEEALGVHLFNRSRSATTLTEAGRELLPMVQRILDDLDHVAESASDLRLLRRGVLRVVAPQLLACTWVAGMLASFGREHPDVRLRMDDADADGVVTKVRRGDAELGIGPERPAGDDISTEFLMSVPIRLVCSRNHPLAGRKRVSWKDLRHERWVTYSHDFMREVESTLARHGGPGFMYAASEVGYLTTALALSGAGVGVLAAPGYAEAFAENFNLAFLTLGSPEIKRKFYIYRRRDRTLSPAAAAFVNALHARVGIDRRRGQAS